MKYRKFALGFCVLLTSAFLGYFSGREPDKFRLFFNIEKNKIHLYLHDPQLLPDKIKNQIEYYSQSDLILSSDLQHFDVALTSWKDFHLTPHLDKKWLSKIKDKYIEEDFLTQPILKSEFVPLFWKERNHEVIIYGLVNNSDEEMFFYELLSNQILLKEWSLAIQTASTVRALENSDLPPQLKPSWIRNRPNIN